jgi:hypothetical protein
VIYRIYGPPSPIRSIDQELTGSDSWEILPPGMSSFYCAPLLLAAPATLQPFGGHVELPDQRESSWPELQEHDRLSEVQWTFV